MIAGSITSRFGTLRNRSRSSHYYSHAVYEVHHVRIMFLGAQREEGQSGPGSIFSQVTSPLSVTPQFIGVEGATFSGRAKINATRE